MTEEPRDHVGKKQPKVLTEIEILGNLVAWTEEYVGRLEKRLVDVLREEVPESSPSEVRGEENLVQLASDIKRIDGKVCDYNKKLKKILERIEL